MGGWRCSTQHSASSDDNVLVIGDIQTCACDSSVRINNVAECSTENVADRLMETIASLQDGNTEELKTWMLLTADRIKQADSSERVLWETEFHPSGRTYVLFIRVASSSVDGDSSMDMKALRVQGVQCGTTLNATRTITHHHSKSHNWWKGKSDSHWTTTELQGRGITTQEMQMVSDKLFSHLRRTPEYLAIVN
eukprot:gene14455-10332_t